MTTVQSKTWMCPRCAHENRWEELEISTPPDGGERWTLSCKNCAWLRPVLTISARGVELRDQLEGLEGDERDRTLAAYRQEIVRH